MFMVIFGFAIVNLLFMSAISTWVELSIIDL